MNINNSKFETRNWEIENPKSKIQNLLSTVYRLPSVVLLLAAFCLLLAAFCFQYGRRGTSPLQAAPSNQIPPSNGVVDNPTTTIAGSTATTTVTPTSGVGSVRVFWKFGTLVGTYSGCTVQAQTSYDGATFLNLGGAEPVTVTSGTLNAWGIYELPLTASVQFPTDASGIAVTPVSTNVATSFGQATQFVFSCTGYGTSAPVTITVIYR